MKKWRGTLLFAAFVVLWIMTHTTPKSFVENIQSWLPARSEMGVAKAGRFQTDSGQSIDKGSGHAGGFNVGLSLIDIMMINRALMLLPDDHARETLKSVRAQVSAQVQGGPSNGVHHLKPDGSNGRPPFETGR